MTAAQKDQVLLRWFNYCTKPPKGSPEQARRTKQFSDAVGRACKGKKS